MSTRLFAAAFTFALTTSALALDPSKPDVPTEESLRQTRWVLANPDGSTTMSGSMEDARRVEKLRKQHGDRFLFVRVEGEPYLITDQAFVDRAEHACEASRALGAKQSALGTKQSALGEKQSELGRKQAEIGRRMAKAGQKVSRAAQSNDEEKMRAYEREMRELEAEMRQYEQPQRELGSQQEAMGREQQAMGRQQEIEAKRMTEEITRVAQDAIASGKAVKL